jgi:hypothetical protein
MRIKRICAVFSMTFVLVAQVSAFIGRQEVQEKSSPKDKPPPTSLIRKDLLQIEDSPLSPPLRNIFAPQRPGSGRVAAEPEEIERKSPEEILIEKERAAIEKQRAEAAPQGYNIRYIGYIHSLERTVAVIIFAGETMAVKPGEMIAEDVTIVKVTPQEIVYQGLDSTTQTVALEGEDR